MVDAGKLLGPFFLGASVVFWLPGEWSTFQSLEAQIGIGSTAAALTWLYLTLMEMERDFQEAQKE